jgi:hypothetical protein
MRTFANVRTTPRRAPAATSNPSGGTAANIAKFTEERGPGKQQSTCFSNPPPLILYIMMGGDCSVCYRGVGAIPPQKSSLHHLDRIIKHHTSLGPLVVHYLLYTPSHLGYTALEINAVFRS